MNETLEGGGQKDPRQDKIKLYLIYPLVVAVVGYTGFVLFQSVYFNYQASQKIEELHQQFADLEQKKLSLEALIAYYQTDTFRELEARKKLGLKLPGEKVVKVEVEKKKEQAAPQSALPQKKEDPNWQKWIDFLGGKSY